MAGVSGVSSDFRDLTAARDQGNARAKLALDMFSYACKKYVGAYAAAMNGVDCIVFTAGVGENTPCVREAICDNMQYLGLEIDKEKNLEKKESVSHSIMSDSLQSHGLSSPRNSPGQNTGVGSCSLLQGIFLTQGLNPGLLHCRQILYQLSHQGSPVKTPSI